MPHHLISMLCLKQRAPYSSLQPNIEPPSDPEGLKHVMVNNKNRCTTKQLSCVDGCLLNCIVRNRMSKIKDTAARLQGVISHNTVVFIVTALRTWNLAQQLMFIADAQVPSGCCFCKSDQWLGGMFGSCLHKTLADIRQLPQHSFSLVQWCQQLHVQSSY